MSPHGQFLIVSGLALALRCVHLLGNGGFTDAATTGLRAGVVLVSAAAAGLAALVARRASDRAAGWWAGLLLVFSWPAVVFSSEVSAAAPLATLAVAAFLLLFPSSIEKASSAPRAVASLLLLGALVAAMLLLPAPRAVSDFGARVAGLLGADALSSDPWLWDPAFERARSVLPGFGWWPGWPVVVALALASCAGPQARSKRLWPLLGVGATWAGWLLADGTTAARALPLLTVLAVPAGVTLSCLSGTTGGVAGRRRFTMAVVTVAVVVVSNQLAPRPEMVPRAVTDWSNSLHLAKEFLAAGDYASAARWEDRAAAAATRTKALTGGLTCSLLLEEVRRRPDSVLLRTLLAETLFAAGRADEASAHLAIGSSLDPLDRAARLVTAESLLRGGRAGAALRRLEELDRELATGRTRALKRESLIALGRHDEAEALAESGAVGR